MKLKSSLEKLFALSALQRERDVSKAQGYLRGVYLGHCSEYFFVFVGYLAQTLGDQVP